MANVAKLIFGASIAAVSIATPALAARRGNAVYAHQNGYVTRSSQGSGLNNFVPAPTYPLRDPKTWVGDPAGRPYHYDPEFAPNGQ
jgi:hypothetical protein